MLSRPVSLAIVDDHALFRKTLKNFLFEQNNIQVTIQASDMADLLNKLTGSHVDVLLMDLFMSGVNGNEAVKLVRKEFPAIKILVLSLNADMELIRAGRSLTGHTGCC